MSAPPRVRQAGISRVTGFVGPKPVVTWNVKAPRPRLTRQDDGRYRSEVTDAGQMAKWLPNVKVPVCAGRNNGWMSQLEDRVKAILGPFIFDDVRPLKLSRDDLLTLATWATKSWMAYALLRGSHHNPFTEDEYRAMASSAGPLERSQIWVMHSHDEAAHVAMGIISSLMTYGGAVPDFAFRSGSPVCASARRRWRSRPRRSCAASSRPLTRGSVRSWGCARSRDFDSARPQPSSSATSTSCAARCTCDARSSDSTG